MIRGKALIAGFVFPLLLILTAYALLVPHHAIHGRRVVADFRDATLLAPGHDVRIGGANVGRVAAVTLTGHGTARVTLDVDKDVRLHADATASIRQQDLLGNVYLQLDPGHSTRPLRGAIPVGRTFTGTSVQDLLDTFDQPTRLALQTLLFELGTAVDGRGADLDHAIGQLAPVLSEVERASGEVGAQNAQLGRLLTSTSALTGQLAPRARDIERLIGGLDATLRTTAGRSGALDAGLRRLPATLARGRSTLAALARTADTATPLATELESVAPPLASAVDAVPSFAASARPALQRLNPVLATAADTLAAGRTGLPRLADALDELRTIAPPLAKLTDLLDQPTSKGDALITWTIQGVAAGLGGLAAEPGAEGHHFMRATLTLGCEMFGVPIHPGCLAEVLRQGLGAQPPAARHGRLPVVTRPSALTPGTSPLKAVRPATNAAGRVLPAVGKTVQKIVDGLGLGPRGQGSAGGSGGDGQGSGSVGALLDYLLGK